MNREYVSSRDIGGMSRSSYEAPRDSYTSRDSYITSSSSRRDDYPTPRDTREYVTSRESPRDYIPR
jgi:hypothetical protein